MDYSEELQKACRLGDIELIRNALDQSPEIIDELDQKLGWAPLYRTVICGHLEATQFLLSKGANPNIQNRLGETPLHQAADNDQYKIAELLLKYKSDPNIQQNDGDTALHHSAYKGHMKIVKLLLRHKANPNLQNFVFGKTPLHLAVEAGNFQIVQELIYFKASPIILDRSRKTSIDCAHSQDILKILNDAIENPGLDFNEKIDYPIIECKTETIDEGLDHSMDELRYILKDTPSFEEDNEVTKSESVLEPECERVSNGSVNIINSSRTFSFGGDLSKNNLYRWLCNARLEALFQPLIHNGYDDIECILQLMKSSEPLNLKTLENIGVRKPGYRARFLAFLELEIKDKKVKQPKKSAFSCCSVPNSAPGINLLLPTLQEWLEQMNLGYFHRFFKEAGYDDMDHLLMLMHSNYPITDDVLKNDIGIEKLGHRHRILARLRDEAQVKRHRKLTSQVALTIENNSKATACELCIII